MLVYSSQIGCISLAKDLLHDAYKKLNIAKIQEESAFMHNLGSKLYMGEITRNFGMKSVLFISKKNISMYMCICKNTYNYIMTSWEEENS